MSNSNKVNTEIVTSILRDAHTIATSYDHEWTTLEHVLAALLGSGAATDTMKALKVDPKQVENELRDFFDSGVLPVIPGVQPTETTAVEAVIKLAVTKSIFEAERKVSSIHILLALMDDSVTQSHAKNILQQLGLTLLGLKQYLSHGKAQPQPKGGNGMEAPPQKEITTLEEAEAYLDKFCDNLNKVASEGLIDAVIGREEEVAQLVLISARRSKNNTVMVGEPGVGKTAIAEGLALKIVRKEVPEILHTSVVYSLNIGNLIAGTKYRGEFEDRMRMIIKSLEFIPAPILFIDEIHMIMGAGSGGGNSSMDVANLLKPALAKGKMRCIGSTTFDEFQKHFEKDRALLRRFQRVDINEPTVENAKLIMRGLKAHYEKFHGVTYTEDAIDQAVELTSRYVQNRFLPDKAIDVIDAAGARQRIRPEAERLTVVDTAQVQYEVSKIAKIPEQSIKEDEKAKLTTLESELKSAVFGQDSAIDVLVDSVMVSRAGLRTLGKPAGAYLFTGPTGVGKSETVKQLAKTLGIPLVKFDMSEYMEKHSVAKLIGAPPGYVGHGEGGAGSGLLTGEIEKHPHCILLLDEIEKAHPDIFNIFLQVMDDGRLTNSAGKTVRFDNVFIIMTSNAGASQLQKASIGFGKSERNGEATAVINRTFSPEFRNRLDSIVSFSALKRENMLQVVDKFLGELRSLLGEQKLNLNVTEAAKEYLAREGYDELMGARPLTRVINDKLKKPLSRTIIFNRPPVGTTIMIDFVNDAITISEVEAVPEIAEEAVTEV